MPHIVVKLYPGKTETQKQALADAIVRDVIEHLGNGEASISVAFEEVAAEHWAEQVYRPDIVGNVQRLYKKPGYAL